MLRPFLVSSLIVMGIAGAMLSLGSCSDKEKDPSNKGEMQLDDDYYEFRALNLEEHGIPGVILLPDETANIGASTNPEVKHIEDDIYWEISVGPNFTLNIEDWAGNNDLVKVEKKELAAKKFFKVKYLLDEPDLIIYERTLLVKGTDKASPTVGVEHKTYHVYGQKTIDNVNYSLESREEGYEQMIIELMAKSIRSFKPNSAS